MVKLIASLAYLAGDNRVSEFTDAVTMFAFEFGRYTLYKKEKEIVNQFIDSQYIMDIELQKKYELFKVDLEEKVVIFNDMVNQAFDRDFKARFKNTVALAISAGIDTEEILKTEEEIDDFFLN